MGHSEQAFGTAIGPDDIAVVGMSVSLPGAASVEAFWTNLRDGVESIEILDEDSLLQAGERPDVLRAPNYVAAAAPLQGFDMFDAEFFGFSPKEAAILDPQHRKFLEVAWSAMEDAGHTPESLKGQVGVYAGCGMGSYFYFNICSNPDLVDDVGMFLLRHTGNDKDFLTTRVSHVFDLKGPSVNVQTACSTSLVAIHYAAEALRKGDCDMALAGGVTIELPQGRGYLFKENEILSPYGHCHAFDHRAQGTVFGSGAGAVALRRLSDAVADGDHIWAVIKGSAINNDGAAKAGYLAPSVDGQSEAVRKALTAAKVHPESIDYVECHGTGTFIGDPIEVAALSEAYRERTDATGYCRLGSVKTNIGHLDTAAGVAGFVKTALSLTHKTLPPSLGYEAPNPTIDFDASPFRVNDRLTPWVSHRGPRRAGVNALGVGGTNAHAILEEAPVRAPSEESDFPFQILCVSGQSKAALEANTQNLVAYLRANPQVDLADVAYTLKEGRRGFAKRRVVVAETATEAADRLEAANPRAVFTHDRLGPAPEVVFMFPGGGAQYAGMARDLYETEPVFADWMDRGLDHLAQNLDFDLRAVWLPDPGSEASANAALLTPSVQLPLIMIVEYALAQLWISWGIKPAALVGHSMGENTAACLAGVLGFEDCIDLVHLRGQLFDTVDPGGMLSISLPLAEVEALIGMDLDIASVNAPELTAVSGPNAALDALAETLRARDVEFQRIPIDIAAHSRMLEPILTQYGDFLRKLDLKPATLPVISNRTGQLLSAEQATSADYWVGQLRNTVRFADCIDTLSATPGRVYLEVGPGKALSALAQMAPQVRAGQVLSSLRHPDQEVADDAYFFGVIGRLWACGVEADWPQIWGDSRRLRLPLPTYAFQRSRYFIEPGKAAATPEPDLPARHEDLADWGYRPDWRPRLADCSADLEAELRRTPLRWLIFEDSTGQAAACSARLAAAGHQVVRVRAGDTYAQLAPDLYQLAPEEGRFGYEALLADLAEAALLPDRIGHFWLVTNAQEHRPGSSFFDRNVEMGLLSLTGLGQALAEADLPQPVHICVMTTGAAQVRDEALPTPEKAMISGPAGVLPREVAGVTVAICDIELPEPPAGFAALLSRAPTTDISPRLLQELLAEPANSTAAWRGSARFELAYRATRLLAPERQDVPLQHGGHYLLTGGYGGIGLTVAEHLMRHYAARVTLVSREALPLQADWDSYLNRHSPQDRMARRIRAVQKLQSTGAGEVLTLRADVCNLQDMRAAVDAAQAAFGPLTGVFHGAGHVADAPLLAKTESQIAAVLAPKVSGLRVLDQIFPDGALALMVLFSSTSTVTRPAGQVDYVAANEYLNAWAKARRGGQTRVIAIDWGIWAETGMAAEAMAARQGRITLPDPSPCAAPLWHSRGFDTAGGAVFRSLFDARTDWLLNEHRTADGAALIPGTGYIELIAEALHCQGTSAPFEIRDLYFLQPFQVADTAPRQAVLQLAASDPGYRARLHAGTPEGYVTTAEAQVAPLAPAPAIGVVSLDQIRDRCKKRSAAPEGGRLRSPQEANLRFGPRWHVLQETALGDGEGLAHLRLPDLAQKDATLLHPGLMDLATGWAISLAPDYAPETLWVPVSYGAIRVFSALPHEIYSHVRLVAEDEAPGTALFDITLTDPTGQVLVEITHFRMQALTGGFGLQPARTSVSAIALGLEAETEIQPLSPDERRLVANLENGIRTADAGNALERALAQEDPQIIVSSLDLPDLIRQAQSSGQIPPSSTSQSFERPDLDTDYVAPRTALEETLAGYFGALLGLSQIGVEDSFFDLGGHSLIAVRLFAQIKRELGLDWPMSVLFEAPSVASLAARIEAESDQPGRGNNGVASEEPAGDAPVFKHLVRLHPGKVPDARPMFIVAGMFGNVLNLRHLAQILGEDRPVYGLQARGLVGADAPHDRIPDAARDYIAEMRHIQPDGPFLVGGFSGGGITAWDIAQQLRASGDAVDALVLLDTPLPVRPSLTAPDKMLIKLAELRDKGAGFVAEWARNRVAWEIHKRQAPPTDQNTGTGFNNRKIEQAFRTAIATYAPQVWDGPVTLYRPALDRQWKVTGGRWVSTEREYVYPDNDWTRFAPNLKVVEVPGDHDGMVLDPNVSVLGKAIRALLAQTARGSQTAPDRARAAE
ncbi:type I polyketide synthase [Tritonibacter horizontis]|uniref:Phenolphthiocerol/phthiocerol polyketide synthase subunit E n=1 Tax=Tritonibacter horizontis TaxID=1768241 RepID=A0A132BVL7_9RHOB|nr:type I polyketide synthase [Tritonibacter horizontis]KUP92421.1 phthiocerol synthesis polyketide synthase type I PpsE [Tritonibacter horizontis]